MKKIFYTLIVLLVLGLSLILSPAPQAKAAQLTAAQMTSCAVKNGGTTSEGYRSCIANLSQTLDQAPSTTCSITGLCPAQWWDRIQTWLGTFFLWLSGEVVYLAAYLLNLSVVFTILHMRTMIDSISGINIAWTGLRDLSNIVFIFLLIWIAVSTILSLSSGASYKKLTQVIIIALLINFSLFFTKIIIDTSNIVTMQFYNAMDPANSTKADGTYGIGNQLISSLNLLTVFDQQGAVARQDLSRNSIGDQAAGQLPQSTNGQLNGSNILMIGIMGSIFFFIAAFVFFIAAILLLVRFVVLIILMVTSPLAYVGMLLPQGASWSKKWWSELSNQAIFAPVFMMLIWVVMRIIKDDNFMGQIYRNQQAAGTSRSGLIDAVVNGSAAAVLQFGIVITLVMAALIIAKQMGNYGGSMAVKLGSNATFGIAGWAARGSFGRGANWLANRPRLQNSINNGGLVTRNLAKITRGTLKVTAANRSFDARALPGVGTLAGATGFGKEFAPAGKGGFAASSRGDSKNYLASQKAKEAQIESNLNKRKLSSSEQQAVDAQQARVDAAQAALTAAYAGGDMSNVKARKSDLKREQGALKGLKTKRTEEFMKKYDPTSVMSSKWRNGNAYHRVAAKIKLKEAEEKLKDLQSELTENNKEIKKIENSTIKAAGGGGAFISPGDKTLIANILSENAALETGPGGINERKKEIAGFKKFLGEEKK